MNRSVMSRQMFKKGGAAFPDLSGDGQVTQKDILMGRGVVDKAEGGIVGLKEGGGILSRILDFNELFELKDGDKIKIFSKSQFSLLWWSGTISSFGDWATLFGSVALASYLGTEAGNSELTAIVPLIARIVPALLSSFAGLIADRYDKKMIMIFLNA